MTNNHPITPPPELVEEWYRDSPEDDEQCYIAIQAARWGFKQCMELDASWLEAKLQKARDEELEACCEWLDYNYPAVNLGALRAARRPQAPPETVEIDGHTYRLVK